MCKHKNHTQRRFKTATQRKRQKFHNEPFRIGGHRKLRNKNKQILCKSDGALPMQKWQWGTRRRSEKEMRNKQANIKAPTTEPYEQQQHHQQKSATM